MHSEGNNNPNVAKVFKSNEFGLAVNLASILNNFCQFFCAASIYFFLKLNRKASINVVLEYFEIHNTELVLC